MKANLFKNFKTLKEKEAEKNLAIVEQVDNVSVEVEAKTRKNGLDPIANISSEEISTNKEDLNLQKIKKSRTVKKEVLEAREALQKQQIENLENKVYAKIVKEDQSKRTYTVFFKADSLEFIKDLVFYKATAERQIFYNQSEAVVEALNLLQSILKNITPRPDFIRDQEKNKKGGRKRNSDEVFDMTTTVYIPGDFFEFIKDVTYNKVVGGNLYYKDWDLLELAVIKLREKYGNKIKPRPDHIREDEKLRGRRSKGNI